MHATLSSAPYLWQGNTFLTLLRWLVPFGIILATAIVAAA